MQYICVTTILCIAMSLLKDETLSIRTSLEIKQLVRMAAERERRSVSSMIEILVLDYARQHNLQLTSSATVDEAKENILAVLRKCNPGKLSGDKQSVSDSQSKKENAKAETLISEMEADLTEDGTKESHSDAPDEDLSIQKETMDKKSAEQEENEGGQEV
jgi:uncharacterized protein (DUF1778 family)